MVSISLCKMELTILIRCTKVNGLHTILLLSNETVGQEFRQGIGQVILPPYILSARLKSQKRFYSNVWCHVGDGWKLNSLLTLFKETLTFPYWPLAGWSYFFHGTSWLQGIRQRSRNHSSFKSEYSSLILYIVAKWSERFLKIE